MLRLVLHLVAPAALWAFDILEILVYKIQSVQVLAFHPEPRQWSKMSFSCICYAVQQETHNGPIKIGITHNIKARVAALQNGCAHRLVVLGTWPGSREIEKEIHRELKEYRMSGEWFQPSRAVMGLVSRYVGGDVSLGSESHWEVKSTERVMSIKNAVIDYVNKKDFVTFAELTNRGILEEGDCLIGSGEIENLVYWSGISEDSVDAMSHVFKSGLVSKVPATKLLYMIDGIYLDLPIMDRIPKGMRFPVEHWIPVCLRPAAKREPPKHNKKINKKTANV